jgi:hypothetical protein
MLSKLIALALLLGWLSCLAKADEKAITVEINLGKELDYNFVDFSLILITIFLITHLIAKSRSRNRWYS